eukprot:m.60165 g.60165  ORF g.60165 m.60165 type:complete len:249 (+) comp34921_c0_seq2:2441-3187(+)
MVSGSSMAGSAVVPSLKNGHLFYVRVRCQNFADLESTNSSQGILYVTSPPTETLAFIETQPVASVFDTTEGYQMDNDTVSFWWSGFDDPTDIAHYEVSVAGPSVATGWVNVGRYNRAKIGSLGLLSGRKYSLSVRAVNVGNWTSRAVQSEITVVQDEPIATGSSVTGRWKRSTSVDLSWVSAFLSVYPVKYVVSIGSRKGSSDLLQWKETKFSSIIVDVGLHRELFVTVTAVNPVGLSSTVTSIVSRP